MERVTTIEKQPSVLEQKLKDYAALTKIKLSLTVGISAGLGYLFGADLHAINWAAFGFFFTAGLMVTCASNIFNEIIEKDSDKLMTRTMNRPLPTGTMTVAEAMLSAGIMGVLGVLILAFKFNLTAGVLAAVSLLSYAFIYTPLKKVSSIAVFVGAIPGALPPMIGYVCALGHGEINYFIALTLFGIQFLWQFPHFWSIAWIRHEEYLNAGINMMPSASGKTRMTAIHSVIYCAGLILVSVIPYCAGMIDGLAGQISTVVIGLSGLGFLYLAGQHYHQVTDASAKKVMFASFLYLPVVQLALVLGRL